MVEEFTDHSRFQLILSKGQTNPLNTLMSESMSMSSASRSTTSFSDFFIFAHFLIECTCAIMSLIYENVNINDPNAKVKKQAKYRLAKNNVKYWSNMANKKPDRFFQLNGNLWIKKNICIDKTQCIITMNKNG